MLTDVPALTHLMTTLGSREDALRLSREAVEARVAACVQVLGPIESVYRWQGEVRQEPEFLCLLKVPAAGLPRLAAFVRDRHPYETPELTELPAGFVDPRYLAWAEEVVPAQENGGAAGNGD
jgi:periplasmic divalent cation tolerance protein